MRRGQSAGWRRAWYADAGDPRLFVPKRTPIGSTLNVAHRWAWPLLALMVVVPLAGLVVALVLAW